MPVMARPSLQSCLFLAFWISSLVQAGSVEFFYNVEKDTCNWGTNSIRANNNTENGGLCAYVAATKRVYACPAPDTICWTLAESCNRNNGSSPGPDQIQCNRNGALWCCENGETCSTTKNQINVCWGQFGNPNNGVQVAAAVSAEFSAVPSSAIATTVVTALPSVITTSSFGVTPNTATTSTSTSTSSSTSTPSSDSSRQSHSRSSKSLSGGAIAGIVIGVLVGVGLLIGAVFFLMSRRRRSWQSRTTPPDQDHQNQMSEGRPFIPSTTNELYGSQPTTKPDAKHSPSPSPAGLHEVDGGPSSSVSQLHSDGPTSATVTSGSVYSQPSALQSPVRYDLQPPVRYELQ